jgi:hypothetical protein
MLHKAEASYPYTRGGIILGRGYFKNCKLERIWKFGRTRSWIPGIFVEGLRKTRKFLSPYRWCFGRKSNRVYPGFKSRALWQYVAFKRKKEFLNFRKKEGHFSQSSVLTCRKENGLCKRDYFFCLCSYDNKYVNKKLME